MESGTGVSALAGDPRFFRRTGPHTLAAVVDAAEAEAPPRRLMLHQLAPLTIATQQDISFCINHRKNLSVLAATQAAAVIVHPSMKDAVPEHTVPIVATDPLAAWSKVAALFHPLPPVNAGIHPAAIVAATAQVHPTAEVGPLAIIGENVIIGPRGRIGAMVAIGDGVVIGADVRIGVHASVSHALIGDRVYLYPGARIGQDGFGFTIGSDGFRSVPQVGRVVIEDDVEVGANSTIDRGAVEDTTIGAGTRIDNLVQIGHNVRTGKCCVFAAQAGLAGSVTLGDYVMLGGQAGVADHVSVTNGVRVAAHSGVMADVTVKSDLAGAPAQPAKAFFREVAMIRRWVRSGHNPAEDKATKPESPSDVD